MRGTTLSAWLPPTILFFMLLPLHTSFTSGPYHRVIQKREKENACRVFSKKKGTRDSFEPEITQLLQSKFPPMRLEKRRNDRSKRETERRFSFEEASLRLSDELSERGKPGATLSLGNFLVDCYREGFHDLVLAGYFSAYRVETLNKAYAERLRANSTTIKMKAMQNQSNKEELVLLAAMSAFAAGDVALGREALKAGDVVLPAAVRSSLIAALAKGGGKKGGAQAFQLALRLADESRDGGITARAAGEIFKALRRCGPTRARVPAWAMASLETSELCEGALSGPEELFPDPRERLVLCQTLLHDMRYVWGLKPHPETGGAVATTAFRAALEEEWASGFNFEIKNAKTNEVAGVTTTRQAAVAFGAVKRALEDAKLGWGYGALHTILEGSIALDDIDTAGRVLNIMQAQELSAKDTTFQAMLRPLADHGDGAAALAVLEHIVQERKELAKATTYMSSWKKGEEEEKWSGINDDEFIFRPKGGWAIGCSPLPPTTSTVSSRVADSHKKYRQRQRLRQLEEEDHARLCENVRQYRRDGIAAVSTMGKKIREMMVASRCRDEEKGLVEPDFDDEESLSLVIKALMGHTHTYPHALALLRVVFPEAIADDESNLRMNSHLWETALIVHALIEAGDEYEAEAAFSRSSDAVKTDSLDLSETIRRIQAVLRRRNKKGAITGYHSGNSFVEECLTVLSVCHGKAGREAGHQSLLASLKPSSFEISRVLAFPPQGRSSFYHLLQLCAKSRDATTASDVIEKLHEKHDQSLPFNSGCLASAAATISRSYQASDRELYSAAIIACADANLLNDALSIVNLLDKPPSQDAYIALIQAFGKALDLSAALGCWEELRSIQARPSRAAYKSIIDASITHPSGLGHACENLSQMKTDGYDFLSRSYHECLIRSFEQARYFEAALSIFRSAARKQGGVVAGEAIVDEDTLAALVEACRRSGDAENTEEALRLLAKYGVRPPEQLLDYLRSSDEKDRNMQRSSLYDNFFGQEDKNDFVANKVVSRNLKRVTESVIGDAYEGIQREVSFTGDDKNFYSRRPRRATSTNSKPSTEPGVHSSVPGAKAKSSPEKARVWTFDGQRASVNIREIAKAGESLKITPLTPNSRNLRSSGGDRARVGSKKDSQAKKNHPAARKRKAT